MDKEIQIYTKNNREDKGLKNERKQDQTMEIILFFNILSSKTKETQRKPERNKRKIKHRKDTKDEKICNRRRARTLRRGRHEALMRSSRVQQERSPSPAPLATFMLPMI